MFSSREVLACRRNVVQKLRCTFQVPICAFDASVAQVGREGEHVAIHLVATHKASLQRTDSEAVTKIVESRKRPSCGPADARFLTDLVKGR